jgi:hypothetical protein
MQQEITRMDKWVIDVGRGDGLGVGARNEGEVAIENLNQHHDVGEFFGIFSDAKATAETGLCPGISFGNCGTSRPIYLLVIIA